MLLSRCTAKVAAHLRSAWNLVDPRLITAVAVAGQQTAGLAGAASAAAANSGSKKPNARRGKGGGPRNIISEQHKQHAQSQPVNKLSRLAASFKRRVLANDVAGAEHYLRSYVQAGGKPLHWMLPMLLSCYGRLRQADKVWAVYQRVLAVQSGGGQGAGQQQVSDLPPLEARAAALQQHIALRGQLPQQQQPAQQQLAQQQQGVEQQELQAVQLRRLEAEAAAESAARLVAELRLDALPLDLYGYSAVITSLSRAEHPPYDLPPLYAHKAAAVFRQMRGAGVEPNVVLWHNLLDCQAKAGLAGAAFDTYKAMRAAGAAPTSWTFSMLVSACGRAGQPGRALEVVERLMPQAGVEPQLPVWNALLGAFGRAGSVDAAYAVWLQMLDSGVTPDDCTERVLALAFGSHPSLAADVVAEARQVQDRRRREAAAAAASAQLQLEGTQQQQQQQQDRQQLRQQRLGQGSGGWDGGAAGAVPQAPRDAEGRATAPHDHQAPYRLHQHRQARLEMDNTPQRQQRASKHKPLGRLLLAGSRADAPDQRSAAGAGTDGGQQQQQQQQGHSAAAAAAARDAEQAQLRDLLQLDLHGSSQAAARMVLLRRLESLILHAPELIAQVEQLQEQWQQHNELWQQRQQLQLHKAEAAVGLLAAVGTASGGSATTGLSKQQQQQQQQGWELDSGTEADAWPVFGRHWEQQQQQQLAQFDSDAAQPLDASSGDEFLAALPSSSRGPPPFRPPSFLIVTGAGRHSKGDVGGVLKTAVRQLLLQQGLPFRQDPSNSGKLAVPWQPLKAYLLQQRQTMHTDRFLTAARIRYMYIVVALSGVAAAAHILPRLGPWMV